MNNYEGLIKWFIKISGDVYHILVQEKVILKGIMEIKIRNEAKTNNNGYE